MELLFAIVIPTQENAMHELPFAHIIPAERSIRWLGGWIALKQTPSTD